MKIDISKAFATNGEPVSGLLQRPGVGYYIPLYQRDYSWDTENVEQLMEDVRRGVDAVLDDEATAIHFLGTVLLVTERNTQKNIQPLDSRALPPRIDNVIDGQQRLSTLALLASLLYQRLDSYKSKLPADHELHEPIETYLAPLLEMFSVDIRRGKPSRKPVIVRGSVDGWTLDGPDADNYCSPVAGYLASVIRAIYDKAKSGAKKASYPKPPERKSSLVGKNLGILIAELKRVEEAYNGKAEDFPPAWDIVERMPQEDLWNYERSDLKTEIVALGSVPVDQFTPLNKTVCSIIQLFAFSHFLLQRCCLTVIEPVEERWAFDMFQSLNATGTPLTAVETFKPMVVNTIPDYKGSESEDYLEVVFKLLGRDSSVASKTKITNQYLTTLALSYDASKLAVRFGAQRKWLQSVYEAFGTDVEAQKKFVRIMGGLATYWDEVVSYDPAAAKSIRHTETVPEADRDLGAMCALYLQSGGHSISHSILSRFYSRAIREEPGGAQDFVDACKAVAAFFTLWRSALPNTGLDDVYRTLLRDRMSWKMGDDDLTVAHLKQHFVNELAKKAVGTKEEWKPRAATMLRYDLAQAVCRFSLFVAAHDTIPDPAAPGLMKMGTSGIASYLTPTKWRASALSTVEHVAPQRPPTGAHEWDPQLYEKGEYDRVGNLTLLPREINASAGNRRWVEKYMYYRHLMEQDPAKLDALAAEAKERGVSLNPDTIDLLKSADYNHHINPIVALGPDGPWDSEFVARRSERICDIVWDRVFAWLT